MLLILAFLYIFQRFTQSDAAPLSIGNCARQTTLASPLSESDCVCPQTRSIWDIVWSCLVTIFACSWVSVHPNISGKDQPRWKKYLLRLELMAWSIIAPELIISWAMRQWLGARRLAKEYQGKGWTMTHGYFIQMGGFMLYDSEGQAPKEVLSPDNLGYLLDSKQIDIPSIDEEEIQDRSKGDGLAKALVIAQTTWFIIQCIARKAQGLVITELELVTLAFATLNGVMYFLWWNKPLDVDSTFPVYLKKKDEVQIATEVTVNDNNSTSEEETRPEHANSAASPMCNMTIRDLPRKVWRLLSGVLYRWPYAGVAAIMKRIGDIIRTTDVYRSQMHVKPFYADEILNIEAMGLFAGIGLIGALFGAIHCAGWNFFFPSVVEANIWRVSSSIIVGVPAISAIIFGSIFFYMNFHLERVFRQVFRRVLEWVRGPELRSLQGPRVRWMRWWPKQGPDSLRGLELLTVGLLLIYILARLTLVVEALIALRNLPIEALAVVEWTLFLPHI